MIGINDYTNKDNYFNNNILNYFATNAATMMNRLVVNSFKLYITLSLNLSLSEKDLRHCYNYINSDLWFLMRIILKRRIRRSIIMGLCVGFDLISCFFYIVQGVCLSKLYLRTVFLPSQTSIQGMFVTRRTRKFDDHVHFYYNFE